MLIIVIIIFFVLNLTTQHTRARTPTRRHRRETTGFTMSVGRLAEPPKPSFLLLCEVSQSHPFMWDACKPMHTHTMTRQRDMAVGRGRAGEGREGENGPLSKCVRADKHQRTTTVFKMSISGNEKSNGSRRGCTADTEEGRRTRPWRAVSHRKRPHVTWPCANMLGSNLMHLRVSMSVEARASSADSKKLG